MNRVIRLLFVLLASCGGAVVTGDDAVVTPDAAHDAAAPLIDAAIADGWPDGGLVDALGDAAGDHATTERACRVDGVDYTCTPGSSWTWGTAAAIAEDAGMPCWQSTCTLGAPCELTAGSDVGACEALTTSDQ